MVPPHRVRFFLRLIELTAISAIVYGLADLVFSWNPLAAAPYLAAKHQPVFRAEPLLWLGVLAESLNGWIVTGAYLALRRDDGPERARWLGAKLGLVAFGFWVVSGTLTTTVWLDVPWQLSAVNVAFGLPKCLVIGWAVAAWGGWRLPPWTATAAAVSKS